MHSLEQFLQQNNLKDKTVSEQKHFLRKLLIKKRESEFDTFKDKNKWGEKQFLKTLSLLNLSSQDELEDKFRIASFFPIKAELNFIPYAKSTWLFPKVSHEQLIWFEYGDGRTHYQLNRWKIAEKPDNFCFEYQPTHKPLICFVPGLAGDRQGHRLGYGRGYYDKFLGRFPSIISILCLPSNYFLFDHLPKDIHDIQIKHIVI